MSNSFQIQRYADRTNWRRVLLLSAGLFLLLTGVVLLFMSALNVVFISSALFNTLEAAMTVLGVVVTIWQWLFPSGWHSSGQAQDVNARKKKIYCRQVKHSLNKTLSKGILIVFANDNKVAHEVSLVDHRSWNYCPLEARDRLIPIRKEAVKRYRIREGYLCAAVLRDLDPGDYILWLEISDPISVSVFINEVAIVELQ